MPTYGPPDASCEVLTFKEGLLSAVAHDLKLAVERFSVDVDGDTVRATFDARSLRVVCAMKGGREARGALGDHDKAEIERAIVRSVLHADAHPEIRFASTSVERDGATLRVRGDLTLHGVTRAVVVEAAPRGGRIVGTARLHQPDFGVKPYTALLGALKIEPDVEVAIAIPAPAS